MPIRIKYIIPFPFDEEGIANRAAQIPHDILGPDTVVECIPVRNSITNLDSYYEATLLDAYITEAGLCPSRRASMRSAWTPCRTRASTRCARSSRSR